MRTNGKSVRLIAQPLQIKHNGRIDRKGEFTAIGEVKRLAASMTVWAFGHADKGDVLNAQFAHDLHDRAHLPFAAVDEDKVRPVGIAFGLVIIHQPPKSPCHNFAHHGEVIARCGIRIFDVKLTILAFDETFRSCHNHRAQRVSPLNMAVVIDFDPARRFGQFKQVSHLLQQFTLRRALGQSPVERLFGVTCGLFDQAHTVTALRHADFNLAFGTFGQGLRQQVCFSQLPIYKNGFRRGYIFIKLREEARKHFIFTHFRNMRGEEGTMPPILSAANEKRLNAHHPVAMRQRKDIGVAYALGVDRLRPLNEGERPQPVPNHRGTFKVECLGRRLHLLGQFRLNSRGFTVEE